MGFTNFLSTRSSEPTVWDGDWDSLIAILLVGTCSKPTVWDVDPYRNYRSLDCNSSSEPTVWDGDYRAYIELVEHTEPVPSPQCGMETTATLITPYGVSYVRSKLTVRDGDNIVSYSPLAGGIRFQAHRVG